MWQQNVANAKKISQLTQLMTQLNEGMSLPTQLIKRDKGVQRMRLQLFKFWPNQYLKEAWLTYCGGIGDNLNALFLSLKILEQTTSQFAARQVEKGPKKTKSAG